MTRRKTFYLICALLVVLSPLAALYWWDHTDYHMTDEAYSLIEPEKGRLFNPLREKILDSWGWLLNRKIDKRIRRGKESLVLEALNWNYSLSVYQPVGLPKTQTGKMRFEPGGKTSFNPPIQVFEDTQSSSITYERNSMDTIALDWSGEQSTSNIGTDDYYGEFFYLKFEFDGKVLFVKNLGEKRPP